MRNLESKLQKSCVNWFDYQYPQHKMLLFAIPNGGKRNAVTAAILKAEGVRSGVADLFLAIPKIDCCGVFIEMKFGKNTQSESQKEFQKKVESVGYRYELIYDFDSFVKLIEDYLCKRKD